VPETAHVRVSHVTKRFGGVTAVDDVSFEVPKGSFATLLGPSGCGKTTTLRMIGGFEEPSDGRILLGDRDVTGLPPYRRDVNTVFQSYALFPHLDVWDNIAFGLREARRPRAEITTRVSEAIRLVHLGGREHARPHQLSGGQQQRVALARAVVNQPDVLLLDEPLGALDLRLRKQLQIELKRIQKEVGITFVHVTHDQEEAMTMADEIVIMHDGRIEQQGSPTQLYEQPQTAFVASFLGVSNLLYGSAVGEDHDLFGEQRGLLRVVRDQHGRNTHLVLDPPQFAAQLVAYGLVERGERLIEQEEVGSQRQRSGERHPLALPARQLGGEAIPKVSEPQAFEPRGGECVVCADAEGDLAPHAEVREQSGVLRDPADAALLGVQPAEIPGAEANLPDMTPSKARETAKRERLARPGGSEQREVERAALMRELQLEAPDPRPTRAATHSLPSVLP